MSNEPARCPCGDGPDDPELLRVVHGVAYCHDVMRDTGDPTHAQRAMSACRRNDNRLHLVPAADGRARRLRGSHL